MKLNRISVRFLHQFKKTTPNHPANRWCWPHCLSIMISFRKREKNTMLLEDRIKLNPTAITVDNLAVMAWEIKEPEFLRKQKELAGRFHHVKSNSLGSEDINEVAVALVEGRVDTLIIESGRIIASQITNLVTYNVQNKDMINPKVDDLLDVIIELVMRIGSHVTILPADQIASESGVAAIYKY